MSTRVSKSSSLRGLRARLSRKDEAGAGGLLPIITVGMLIVIVAASIAASTSFAAKISNDQVKEVSRSIEVKSLLNNFLSDAQRLPSPTATASIAGAGSYKVYYSTATARPKSSKDSGVVAMSSSGLPTGVRWLVVDMVTSTSGTQTAVYSYLKRSGPTMDNIVSWSGSANITDSYLGRAPGTHGIASATFRGSTTTNATQSLTISGGSSAADIYANYATAVTKAGSTTVRGNLSSKSAIEFPSSSQILGNVTSGSTVSGTAEIAGSKTTNNTTALPYAPPGHTSANVGFTGQVSVTLTDADCSTPAKLKAKVESYAASSTGAVTVLNGADLCAASSWSTEVKPKTSIMFNSAKALPISGLKVTGSAGTLGFHSATALSLTNVVYSGGAAGQFISAGTMTITDSNLNGAITNYGTAGGTLDMNRSSMLYTPLEAPRSCSSSGTCSAWSSYATHLVRVS